MQAKFLCKKNVSMKSHILVQQKRKHILADASIPTTEWCHTLVALSKSKRNEILATDMLRELRAPLKKRGLFKCMYVGKTTVKLIKPFLIIITLLLLFIKQELQKAQSNLSSTI